MWVFVFLVGDRLRLNFLMQRRRGLEGSGAVISRLPEKAGVKAKEERAHGESGEQCLDGEWEFVGKEEVEEEWTVV